MCMCPLVNMIRHDVKRQIKKYKSLSECAKTKQVSRVYDAVINDLEDLLEEYTVAVGDPDDEENQEE